MILIRTFLRSRTIVRFGILGVIMPTAAAAQPPPSSVKVAYFNIQSGKGEQALPGHEVTFTENSNCTDPTRPMNAWGTGLIQSHLVESLGNDPRVIALGLGEAWGATCGSPERVRQALGWKARSVEQNGVAIVVRHGFSGPLEWLQLDTSLNPNPADTMWVVRAPVCVDAACSLSVDVFVAHWLGSDTATNSASLDRQGRQTVEFLRSRGSGGPHVLVADLNAWEGTPACSQTPDGSGLSHLRGAGYIDAWPAVHGAAEGFTGMVNRSNCGVPVGYPFKRIDYAWSPPGFQPLSIERFGMVPPGDGAPSDHYGIVAEYPWPWPPPPGDEIVLYTRHAAPIAGTWKIVPDFFAAGGATIAQPDAGAPKLAEPLAAPGHYFDLTFTARAGVGYRLWIRGKAERDHWTNDSIYAQFSGAITESGSPVWRIGTTSATTIVLEDCAGCPLGGWGWQDNGYGRGALGPLVYFAASGAQSIRFQTREDGLSIDQVVLSSRTYLTDAPGPTTGDTTIVPVPTPANRGEVVLRAAEASATSGAWHTVEDSSAAGGTAVTHPNANAPRVSAPLAEPVDFVEFTFEAEAGRPYRLWIRGRADADSWSNDSVFVQFSGTVASDGTPVYRIGSESATPMNLEAASNAGLSGWGWQDNGYGEGVLGPQLLFQASGPQTIRIQTREDGLRIDQIVLSSARFLDMPPGAPKNDTTIIP